MTALAGVFREVFDLPLPVFAALLGLLGLLLGSFLNVVIARLPTMMQRDEQQFVWLSHPVTEHKPLPADLDDSQGRYTLYTPASHCPGCHAPVRWWMNIPLLSFALLKARCAHCKTAISWQYPLVEALAALAGVAAALHFGVTGKAIAITGLLWVLLALTVIDLNTQLLPDSLTLPLLWTGLLINSHSLMVTSSAAIWGAAIGYLSLWSIYQLFKLLTGKEGMGYGDFKLLAALGAWLGVGMILPIILFASLAGSVVGGVMIASKRLRPENAVAFGPYLAAGGVLAAFFGNTVVSWYLGFLN
jgi:leader peptidase (prepilin peptidase) / N-methyltransferase